jgi:hypothetical protein
MLTVFVVGYGVAAYSLLYGSREFDWHILREILNLAYWEIFGDLNALEAFGSKQIYIFFLNLQMIHSSDI